VAELPAFPVDDATLDLIWSAIHPDPEVEDRSSLSATLQMLSELGGSDTSAVAEIHSEYGVELRDPQYSEHDLIAALIAELRWLRSRGNDAVAAVMALHTPEPGWATYYDDSATAWAEAPCGGCKTYSSTVTMKDCRTRKAIEEAMKP